MSRRISDLPKEILSHIGSFLSVKEAARTQILSKNWRNLITIIPILVFDQSIHNINRSFRDFCDELLATPASHCVMRFFLRLTDVVDDDSQYNKLVNDCLRNVLKRGVMDLELDIKVKGDYSLPLEIFSCRTVVKMKLGSGFVIDNSIPRKALLSGLKSLRIESVRFNGLDGCCAFQRLLSVCPVLEELVIVGFNGELWNWSRIVSSQSLERLTIRREEEPEYDQDDPVYDAISFDAPRLTYLEYADVLQDEYPVVNLNSLVEAKLNFTMFSLNRSGDLTNLVKGLKSVQILRLDWIDELMMLDGFTEAMPVFENMSHLSLPTEAEICWSPAIDLLEKSPNLKILTLGKLHYNYQTYLDLESVCECLEGYSFLKSCRIETLKITEFKADIGEMVQIKHILQNLPCVELVEIHVDVKGDYIRQQITEVLQRFPRASANCKVEVKFS